MGHRMANKAYLLVIRYAYQKNTPILVGSLVLLLLSFYAPILWATTPTTDQPGQPLANFYVFQIPTDNQTVVDREKQIREAFQRMLVTLSGTSEILQKPRVVSVLKQVDNFVSQFTYEGFGKDATQPKTLKVTFSEKATNNLIKALGYHLWNAPRVDTLVWLALEKEDEKYWVNAETEANMWSTVQQALGNIRVPMVSPLFDLMDETEFSVGAAWQKKFVTVPAMMQRYGVDSCLLGLLREHPGGWHAEWFLFARSVTNVLQQGWQVSRMELPDLLQNSVDHLGVSLAKGVSGKALVSADSTEVVEALEPIIAAETVPPKNSEEGTQIAISGAIRTIST